MATFWAIRMGNTLRPDGAESAAVLAKLPYGQPIRIEARAERNPKLHRLYWVLCHRIADAVGADPENVSDLLKIETGHCRIVNSKRHGTLRFPSSISFSAVDEASFRDFFERCLNVIYSEWGIGRADVLAAVNDVLMPGLVENYGGQ